MSAPRDSLAILVGTITDISTSLVELRGEVQGNGQRMDRVERVVDERGPPLERATAALEAIAKLEAAREEREAAREEREALALATREERSHQWLVRVWEAPGVQQALLLLLGGGATWLLLQLGVSPTEVSP